METPQGRRRRDNGDGNVQNAIHSLSAELDELSRSLEKNVTFENLNPNIYQGYSVELSVSSLGDDAKAYPTVPHTSPRRTGKKPDPTGGGSAPTAKDLHQMNKYAERLNDILRQTREDRNYSSPRTDFNERSYSSPLRTHPKDSIYDNFRPTFQSVQNKQRTDKMSPMEPPDIQSPSFHFYSPSPAAPKPTWWSCGVSKKC